jgi:hypothetical protein
MNMSGYLICPANYIDFRRNLVVVSSLRSLDPIGKSMWLWNYP